MPRRRLPPPHPHLRRDLRPLLLLRLHLPAIPAHRGRPIGKPLLPDPGGAGRVEGTGGETGGDGANGRKIPARPLRRRGTCRARNRRRALNRPGVRNLSGVRNPRRVRSRVGTVPRAPVDLAAIVAVVGIGIGIGIGTGTDQTGRQNHPRTALLARRNREGRPLLPRPRPAMTVRPGLTNPEGGGGDSVLVDAARTPGRIDSPRELPATRRGARKGHAVRLVPGVPSPVVGRKPGRAGIHALVAGPPREETAGLRLGVNHGVTLAGALQDPAAETTVAAIPVPGGVGKEVAGGMDDR